MNNATIFAIASIAFVGAGIGLAWARPDLVVRRAAGILMALALVSVGALGALVDPKARGLHIRLDPSEEPMLPADAPTRPIYTEAVHTFGDDDLFVIGMRTDGVFTTRNLRTLREIGNRIRRLTGVRAAESVVDTTSYSYDADLDLVDVGHFIDDIPTDPAALASLRRRATTDRIYTKTIVSRDGQTAAINVSFRTMTDGEFIQANLDESIRAIVDTAAGPDHAFFITGRKHIKAEAYHLMIRDLLRLIPLAVLVGASVAWIVTGSTRSAVVPVGASLIATLWTFGALAVLDQPLNLITVVLGPMLICVGSVYGVHVLARYDAILADGRDRHAAAVFCLRYVRAPVSIAGLTTCIGFGTLATSDTPAIAQLGAFAVLGTAAVTLISLTGLPALFGLLPDRGDTGRRASRVMAAVIQPLIDGLVRVVSGRPGAVLAVWSALTIGAVVAIPRIAVDTDYLTFFDTHSRVRRDFASMNRLIVGPVPIYVTLTGDGEGTFREPANLRAVENLQRRIDALPGVSATLSVVDLVEMLNRVIEKDDPAAERIPDSRGKVADLMFLIPKNKLRAFANANHSSVNILVRTGASGSAAILELERRLRAVVAAEHLPSTLHPEVTGNAIVLNNAADGVARNQFSTVGATATAILLLITGTFRSLSLGLLAMIPNIVPVLLFFGILGTGAAALSLPTSLIGCMALGIAIDDTAHFLVGYRHRRTGGAPPRAAAEACIRTLGPPIIITSLMLVAGFLVLSFSTFATLREFGYLSASTMLICLTADLLLLPALLVRARV